MRGPGRAGRSGDRAAAGHRAALSIDNLAVGFALGTFHVSLALAVIVIGAMSVAMSLIGLEPGSRIGPSTGERGELPGDLVLIGVGIAVASGVA